MHPRTTARTSRAARLTLASIVAAAALTFVPAAAGIVAGAPAQTTPPSTTPGSSSPGTTGAPGSETTVPTTSVPTDTTTTDPTGSTSTTVPATTVAPTDSTTPTTPATTVAVTIEPVTSQAVGPPPAASELAAAGPVSGGSPATARPSSRPAATSAQANAAGAELPAVATPPVLADVALADRLDVGPAPVIASPAAVPAVGPRPEVLPNPLALRSAPSGVKLLLLILAVSGLGSAVTLVVSRRHQRAMDTVNLDLLLGLRSESLRRSEVVDRSR